MRVLALSGSAFLDGVPFCFSPCHSIGRPSIFISYARSDSSVLAEELVTGLELAGFEPYLDRHDIAAAEDWEVRLGDLIQNADTIVFILSPAGRRLGCRLLAGRQARPDRLLGQHGTAVGRVSDRPGIGRKGQSVRSALPDPGAA
jgi:TIR domain